MVSKEAYIVIVILIAVIGAYLFFTQVSLPMCEDADECDFRECPEDQYRDCVNGKCACLNDKYEPPNF